LFFSKIIIAKNIIGRSIHMFSTIRQFCALNNFHASHQTHSLFKSLTSSPISPSLDTPNESTAVDEESALWRDLAAAGIVSAEEFECLTVKAC
jgi:hypothetical protein